MSRADENFTLGGSQGSVLRREEGRLVGGRQSCCHYIKMLVCDSAGA